MPCSANRRSPVADPADILPQHQCPTCLAWSPAEACERCEASPPSGDESAHTALGSDDRPIKFFRGKVLACATSKHYGFTGGTYTVSVDMAVSPEAAAELLKFIDDTFGPGDPSDD